MTKTGSIKPKIMGFLSHSLGNSRKKWFRSWKQWRKMQKKMGKETWPLIITKNDFPAWAKWGNNQKREWFHTQEVQNAWERSCEGKMVRKTSKHEKHGRMEYVFGFLLAQGIKMCFPKIDGFSNSNLVCHTLPIPCNNQLNQFLAVINDWVNKTRKVVNNFYGFSLWHLDFPHCPKGLNTPPPILGKSCPIPLFVALT